MLNQYKQLNEQLVNNIRSFLSELLPGGRVSGHTFRAGSISGEAGTSLSVRLDTGAWSDFATGEHGSDLVSLYAAVKGIGQKDALDELAKQRFISSFTTRQSKPKREMFGGNQTLTLIPAPKGYTPPTSGSTHSYFTASGDLAFVVEKKHDPIGKKYFTPWSWDGSKWVTKAWPSNRPLYNIQDALANPEKIVLIVEGEKCVDACKQLHPSYVPVTWSSGAMAVGKTDFSPLYGRDILIWPDNDEPGYAAADSIIKLIIKQSRSIKLLDVQRDKSLGPGWDSADAISAGMDKKMFVEFGRKVMKYVKWNPEGPENKNGASRPNDTQECGSSGGEEKQEKKTNKNPRAEEFARIGLSLTQNGNIKPNGVNALKILRHYDEISSRLKYNDFISSAEFDSVCIGDGELSKIALAVEKCVGVDFVFSGREFMIAVEEQAKANRYNPVHDWLKSLSWDGVQRLGGFFTKYYGAEDSQYSTDVSRAFLISIVARAMSPGCKADQMVIIEGEQGIMKSSSLRALVGDEYFMPTGFDDTKEFFYRIENALLVEIGELSGFSRRDTNDLKRILSSQYDVIRRPYRSSAEKIERKCIFVGTTNEKDYLSDATGNRRYIPIKVKKIDIDGIVSDKDQLFAEAYVAYQNGEKWWVETDELKSQQEDRLEYDSYSEILIEKYEPMNLMPSRCLSATEILTHPEIFNIEVGRITKRETNGVNKAARKLGWDVVKINTYKGRFKSTKKVIIPTSWGIRFSEIPNAPVVDVSQRVPKNVAQEMIENHNKKKDDF